MTNATELSILQRCARRVVIERDWRLRKWRPRSLFNHCLTELVLNISNGKDPEKASVDAYNMFVAAAANPGLDLTHGVAPFDLAMDFAHALRVTAELLTRMVLLPLKQAQPVQLMDGADDGYIWKPESLADESGALHWWHAIEKYDKDTLVAQGHSWRWGDMAACGVPLTLHLVEIGRIRNGHLLGDLSRIFQHPAVTKYKFRHRDGKALEAGWKTRFLQDMGPKVMPVKRWCDLLAEDLVEPIHHVTMKQPEEWQREEFVNEATAEMDRLDTLPLDWRYVPKSRGACDILGGCPHQALCYGPKGATPESVGGYTKR